MTDVLAKLQNASFRGVSFPVMDTAEFGFAQEFAQHRIIFKDDKLIESLGRENPTYRYTAPMREDIIRGGFQNLFTVVYPDLLNACLDRSPGVLIDPFHGARRCKCASLREIRNVQRRDGIDVELEFILAPQEGEVITDLGSQLRSISASKELARQIDQTVRVFVPQQQQPPEPTLDPFDFVTSIGNQIEVATNKVQAKLLDVASRAEKTADTIDRLKNPKLASTRAAALRLQAAVLRLEDEVAVANVRPVRFITLKVATGASTVAAAHQMTIEQLMNLNPGFVRTPLLKANTEVRVFFNKSSQAR